MAEGRAGKREGGKGVENVLYEREKKSEKAPDP
jgi:hypothetical protein